jgi:CrcB protein
VRVVLIAVFGSLGALSRYGVGQAVGTHDFPWATLGINIVGAFVLDLVLTAGPSHLSDDLVAGLGTGFLGAFTTFSTFGYETTHLLRDDRPTAAATYVALSLVVGLTASAAGYLLGRTLT